MIKRVYSCVKHSHLWEVKVECKLMQAGVQNSDVLIWTILIWKAREQEKKLFTQWED